MYLKLEKTMNPNTTKNETGRVLLLLTETEPNSGYGFADTDILPFTTDGQFLSELGENERGHPTFLISFDVTDSDDPNHPDPGTPPGWNWSTYSQPEPKPSIATFLSLED
jgi:hypothetical protein